MLQARAVSSVLGLAHQVSWVMAAAQRLSRYRHPFPCSKIALRENENLNELDYQDSLRNCKLSQSKGIGSHQCSTVANALIPVLARWWFG